MKNRNVRDLQVHFDSFLTKNQIKQQFSKKKNLPKPSPPGLAYLPMTIIYYLNFTAASHLNTCWPKPTSNQFISVHLSSGSQDSKAIRVSSGVFVFLAHPSRFEIRWTWVSTPIPVCFFQAIGMGYYKIVCFTHFTILIQYSVNRRFNNFPIICYQ